MLYLFFDNIYKIVKLISVGSPRTRSTASNQNVICKCVVGESYPIKLCARRGYTLRKCANHIRPSACT